MRRDSSERVKERLAEGYRIDSETGCWIWDKAKNHGGYGVMRVHGRQKRTHRIAYELYVGQIQDGLQIDHLCRVRACCNPDHLEPVTARENVMRSDGFAAINARKVVCVNGHELTGDNVRIDRGHRTCKPCLWERDAEYRAQRKARGNVDPLPRVGSVWVSNDQRARRAVVLEADQTFALLHFPRTGRSSRSRLPLTRHFRLLNEESQ